MKRCIPISWRCDGDYDCVDEDDKTDEANCRKYFFKFWVIFQDYEKRLCVMFYGSLAIEGNVHRRILIKTWRYILFKAFSFICEKNPSNSPLLVYFRYRTDFPPKNFKPRKCESGSISDEFSTNQQAALCQTHSMVT